MLEDDLARMEDFHLDNEAVGMLDNWRNLKKPCRDRERPSGSPRLTFLFRQEDLRYRGRFEDNKGNRLVEASVCEF